MLGFKGIYMSPDDIFAAQMWPWPEPALKRDAMGRVLFVNAAFLQMYGGSIEDWRGNVVTGWPMPQPPGFPYRFETRLPSQEGESIYDWMEFTLADGNALAMARNITYLFQTPDPDPGVSEQPPQNDIAQAATQIQTAPDMASAAPDESLPVFAEQTQQETVLEAPNFEPVETPASVAQDGHITAEDISLDVNADPVFDSATYADLSEPVLQHAPEAEYEADAVVAPVVEEVVTQAAPVEERAFERRALPIENEDAVLGNNWRDAVIAKAVGAEAPTKPAKEEPPTAEKDNTGGTIRILLAEDNAINALLTRTLLEAEGHTVDTVEDGALAVEAMKSSKYDLIFMDMRMPNMDGLEATRKIRAMDNVSKGLPIIALTANAFDDDRNACFDSGMNDFMTKPVSAEELSEMVRTWTKNKAERDAAAA
jgi:CheY-like chemotaxis protein